MLKYYCKKRRAGYWGFPGNLMDLEEIFEETGLMVENLKLLTVYSG